MMTIPLFEFARSYRRLFNYDNKMPHLVNHSANRRRVFALDDLLHAAKTQAANGGTHGTRAADEADDPLDFDRASFRFRHRLCPVPAHSSADDCYANSSTVLERISATLSMSFNRNSASKVALTTLCGFEVPSDFVSTL